LFIKTIVHCFIKTLVIKKEEVNKMEGRKEGRNSQIVHKKSV
jgi:hypothetical protein